MYVCMWVGDKEHIHLYAHTHNSELLQLGEPESFYYLKQSGCVSDPTINDRADFAKVT